jgi:hypothetical protein
VRASDPRTTIDDMLDAGWYCAPDLYASISRKIDDLVWGERLSWADRPRKNAGPAMAIR